MLADGAARRAERRRRAGGRRPWSRPRRRRSMADRRAVRRRGRGAAAARSWRRSQRHDRDARPADRADARSSAPSSPSSSCRRASTRPSRPRHEPIAIVGIGCRLPGGADGPDALWELLRDGVDAIGEVPADRWDIDAYYDPDLERAREDVDPPRRVPPRRRRLRRRASSASPRARRRHGPAAAPAAGGGLGGARARRAGAGRPGRHPHRRVRRHDRRRLRAADAAARRASTASGAYYASGIAHSIASGRLSYVLGLQGPSISLDTACSSSLVAVHLAVQSLRAGECDLALAGGVNLILSPETSHHAVEVPDDGARRPLQVRRRRAPTASCGARAAPSSC